MPGAPITVGWTGGAGGRQMEDKIEKLTEWGLNLGPQALEPRTQLLQHHTATHTHTHIHIYTHIHIGRVGKWGGEGGGGGGRREREKKKEEVGISIGM